MKKNLLVLIVANFLLTGCSEFYGYQPPAPVYGKSVTNPYENQNQTRSYPIEDTYRQPETTPLHGSTDTVIESRYPAYQQPAMSPAVVALINESERNSRAGDMESAVAVLERALRIDPRNPTLTYKLADLRLQQEKPRLAEDLAKKAALLAANDLALKRKSWLLISEALKAQHNYEGAKEAKTKADSFIAN
jgi:tetratricopeptide (TPR) repeat protein